MQESLASVSRLVLMLNNSFIDVKTILQGAVNGSRKRGGQRKAWIDNIKEWTSQSVSTLLRDTDRREQWSTVCDDASALTSL
jgi:hypothetical protein